MSGVADTSSPGNPWLTADGWRRLFRDQPLIPLIGLLVLLIALVWLVRPDSVNPGWASGIVRSAIPLALLAACQTLTFLTGGIDLSVGAVASMSGFVVATLVGGQGLAVALIVALIIAALAGLLTGIGVGVFKVHPLIMTLGMGLVILGLTSVYQLAMVQNPVDVPDAIEWLGSETVVLPMFGVVTDLNLPFLPNNLLVFIPIAAVIIIGLRRSGYGRLLFAVGDNPVAARLSGARVWQVLVVLYIISALFAALAGFLVAGLVKTATIQLVEESVLPSVAAAVIGGTSIMGGRGGYAGTIVGALILTVLTTLLTVLDMPEAAKQILFGLIIVAVAAAYTRVTGQS
jgi:ribose transport system permease protein